MDKNMTENVLFEDESCGGQQQRNPRILAHSYTPWQFYKKAYSPAEALAKGTLFPELFGAYPIPK